VTFLIHTGAWILCVIVGGLLLSEFIRTEIRLAQAEKKNETVEKEDAHGTD